MTRLQLDPAPRFGIAMESVLASAFSAEAAAKEHEIAGNVESAVQEYEQAIRDLQRAWESADQHVADKSCSAEHIEHLQGRCQQLRDSGEKNKLAHFACQVCSSLISLWFYAEKKEQQTQLKEQERDRKFQQVLKELRVSEARYNKGNTQTRTRSRARARAHTHNYAAVRFYHQRSQLQI